MSHLHFIGGEKGGVGKSLVARILAQYFIDRGTPFTAFDADKSHGALLRFYSAYAQPVAIEQYDKLDAIVEAAVSQPNGTVLVDLAAQTQQALTRWIEDSDLLAITQELGIRLTYWHVMDSGRDSVDLLRRLLDEFGDRLELVIVKNDVRGTSFELLDESGELARAEALGARVVSVRRLNESSMQKIDAYSTSFWAACNQTDAPAALGMLERQRVKVWLKKSYSEFERIGV